MANDEELALQGVQEEAQAYNSYQEKARQAKSPKLKETLKDVADEEIVHAGEFSQRAVEARPELKELMEEGVEEAKEIKKNSEYRVSRRGEKGMFGSTSFDESSGRYFATYIDEKGIKHTVYDTLDKNGNLRHRIYHSDDNYTKPMFRRFDKNGKIDYSKSYQLGPRKPSIEQMFDDADIHSGLKSSTEHIKGITTTDKLQLKEPTEHKEKSIRSMKEMLADRDAKKPRQYVQKSGGGTYKMNRIGTVFLGTGKKWNGLMCHHEEPCRDETTGKFKVKEAKQIQGVSVEKKEMDATKNVAGIKKAAKEPADKKKSPSKKPVSKKPTTKKKVNTAKVVPNKDKSYVPRTTSVSHIPRYDDVINDKGEKESVPHKLNADEYAVLVHDILDRAGNRELITGESHGETTPDTNYAMNVYMALRAFFRGTRSTTGIMSEREASGMRKLYRWARGVDSSNAAAARAVSQHPEVWVDEFMKIMENPAKKEWENAAKRIVELEKRGMFEPSGTMKGNQSRAYGNLPIQDHYLDLKLMNETSPQDRADPEKMMKLLMGIYLRPEYQTNGGQREAYNESVDDYINKYAEYLSENKDKGLTFEEARKQIEGDLDALNGENRHLLSDYAQVLSDEHGNPLPQDKGAYFTQRIEGRDAAGNKTGEDVSLGTPLRQNYSIITPKEINALMRFDLGLNSNFTKIPFHKMTDKEAKKTVEERIVKDHRRAGQFIDHYITTRNKSLLNGSTWYKESTSKDPYGYINRALDATFREIAKDRADNGVVGDLKRFEDTNRIYIDKNSHVHNIYCDKVVELAKSYNPYNDPKHANAVRNELLNMLSAYPEKFGDTDNKMFNGALNEVKKTLKYFAKERSPQEFRETNAVNENNMFRRLLNDIGTIKYSDMGKTKSLAGDRSGTTFDQDLQRSNRLRRKEDQKSIFAIDSEGNLITNEEGSAIPYGFDVSMRRDVRSDYDDDLPKADWGVKKPVNKRVHDWEKTLLVRADPISRITDSGNGRVVYKDIRELEPVETTGYPTSKLYRRQGAKERSEDPAKGGDPDFTWEQLNGIPFRPTYNMEHKGYMVNATPEMREKLRAQGVDVPNDDEPFWVLDKDLWLGRGYGLNRFDESKTRDIDLMDDINAMSNALGGGYKYKDEANNYEYSFKAPKYNKSTIMDEYIIRNRMLYDITMELYKSTKKVPTKEEVRSRFDDIMEDASLLTKYRGRAEAELERDYETMVSAFGLNKNDSRMRLAIESSPLLKLFIDADKEHSSAVRTMFINYITGIEGADAELKMFIDKLSENDPGKAKTLISELDLVKRSYDFSKGKDKDVAGPFVGGSYQGFNENTETGEIGGKTPLEKMIRFLHNAGRDIMHRNMTDKDRRQYVLDAIKNHKGLQGNNTFDEALAYINSQHKKGIDRLNEVHMDADEVNHYMNHYVSEAYRKLSNGQTLTDTDPSIVGLKRIYSHYPAAVDRDYVFDMKMLDECIDNGGNSAALSNIINDRMSGLIKQLKSSLDSNTYLTKDDDVVKELYRLREHYPESMAQYDETVFKPVSEILKVPMEGGRYEDIESLDKLKNIETPSQINGIRIPYLENLPKGHEQHDSTTDSEIINQNVVNYDAPFRGKIPRTNKDIQKLVSHINSITSNENYLHDNQQRMGMIIDDIYNGAKLKYDDKKWLKNISEIEREKFIHDEVVRIMNSNFDDNIKNKYLKTIEQFATSMKIPKYFNAVLKDPQKTDIDLNANIDKVIMGTGYGSKFRSSGLFDKMLENKDIRDQIANGETLAKLRNIDTNKEFNIHDAGNVRTEEQVNEAIDSGLRWVPTTIPAKIEYEYAPLTTNIGIGHLVNSDVIPTHVEDRFIPIGAERTIPGTQRDMANVRDLEDLLKKWHIARQSYDNHIKQLSDQGRETSDLTPDTLVDMFNMDNGELFSQAHAKLLNDEGNIFSAENAQRLGYSGEDNDEDRRAYMENHAANLYDSEKNLSKSKSKLSILLENLSTIKKSGNDKRDLLIGLGQAAKTCTEKRRGKS